MNKKTRNVLGRGSDALIPVKEETLNSVTDVDISKISPNPYQPRDNFIKEEIDEIDPTKELRK